MSLLGLGPVAAEVGPTRPAGALELTDQAVLGDAFRAARTREWERAFAILGEVDDPLAAKTMRFLRMIEDDGPETFAQLVQFMEQNPHWPLQDRLQVYAEGRITDPADHALIKRFFDARPPITTRGIIRYAQALIRLGEPARGEELLRVAWREGDFSISEARKFRAQYGALLSRDDHETRLDNLLWDYRRGAAADMLGLVTPEVRRLAEARLRLQRRQAGVDRAINAVSSRLQNDAGLLFDRLRWRRQKRRHSDVLELLLDPPPPAELDRPGMWWFEREMQIRRMLRARDFELAYDLSSRHGQTEGVDFAEAEWLAGWLALRFVSQPRQGLQHFEHLYAGVDRPISQARAAYWAGRAAAALGDGPRAATWYERAAAHPATFYGQEAARELGRPLPPAATMPTSAPLRAAFEGRELVRVARMLIGADASAHLSPFLLRLTDDASTPAQVRLVADLAAESGRADLVTLVGKYASYNDVVDDVAAFPIPSIPAMIEPPDGAPDPALVLAVTRQESVFNSSVVSSAGARGLMQLMPATATLVARELNLPFNLGLLTGDPEFNVRLGSRYLDRLLRRYGEPALALAAYNAGPSRVEEWLRLHGDPRGKGRHALIDWMELIPFDETRNYVQRVLENYDVYSRRLQHDDPFMVAVLPVIGPLSPLPRPAFKPVGDAPEPAAAAAEPEGMEDVPVPEPAPPVEARVVPASFMNPPVPHLKPDRQALLVPTPEAKPRGAFANSGAGAAG